MEPNDLPIVGIPLDLPDEAAASLIEFFQDLTQALERHYFGQLHSHYHACDVNNRDPDYPAVRPDPDPPSKSSRR
jgi:hypothetical protein